MEPDNDNPPNEGTDLLDTLYEIAKTRGATMVIAALAGVYSDLGYDALGDKILELLDDARDVDKDRREQIERIVDRTNSRGLETQR